MSKKAHAITAGIALATALAAGGAQAAVSIDGGTLPFTGTGEGELFFSAISRTDQKSITIDLGITANDFRASAGFSQTYSALGSFLATATGPVFFNVGAISNVDVNGGASFADWGILTTANAPIGQLLSTDYNQIGSAMSNAANFLFNVNTKAGNSNPAANDTVVVSDTASFAYHDGGFWGQTCGGAMPVTTEALIGSKLPFYFLTLDLDADPTGGISKGVDVQPGAFWTVSSGGKVEYVVPVPAAVWLLGSALVGGLGFVRRRRG